MTDQTNALLVTVADPFNTLRSRKLARLEVGRTIFETLVEKDYISMTETGVKRHGFFYVTLNGKAVLQKDWNTVISDNDCVGVWTLPQGGGGGSNIGVILITVVMVAAAVFTGGATLGVALAWGAAAGAAVGLLTSLVPAPSTPASGSSIGKDTASSTYTISAQGNTVRVGEAIKVQYGRMRVWPDLAAQPYTETRGNAQYVYQLMVLGQGKLQVERIQIEDSDINSYGEIEYEIIQPGQPVTLFPDNVITSQAVQGLEMLAPDEENFAVLGPYVTSPPGVKTTFIAVDIQLPQGAYKIDDGGNNQPRSVQIGFWAQPINDAGVPSGARQQIVNETLTFSTKTPQMISYKVEMPEGRYQVDGQRMTLKPPDNRTIDKVVWSGLKGYAQSARTFGNVTMIATIIKATNNLNSNTSRRVNTIQTRMLPTWDPVNGWGAEVPTSNPAWAYADALRNSDYGPGWGTNRISMGELYRLSQIWAARGDEFNGIYDNRGTLWQALTQIAMVGRATPQYYAGVMDIVRDEPKVIPAQLFSPGQILQNTFKGSYKLGTMQTPDHVIVKFWNRETWQEDEVLCALPGSTTKVPYTKDMTFGITDHDHAWREGMYAAAVNRDQRSRNSFTVEMPGLLLRFGDLIHVTHDVPGWGYPGKVISFNPTTGKVVTTEPLVFTAGSTHYITFRRKNGKADGPWQVIADPNPTAGVNSAIVQGTVAARQQIFISNGVTMDLTTYAFGPADRESNKMVVLSAKPNAKGETQITVCDYVTSTHIADQGGDVPIPPPISNLPGAPVGPIVNRVTVEMTTTVGEQQIVAEPANGATYYEFEGMPQGGGNWSAFGVSGDPFLFVNLDAGPWIIRVRGVGAIPGPWATWTGTIALTSLPLPRLSKLTATGKIFAIDLAVDYAEETRSISKTLEIWAGRTNVLGNATLLVRLPYPATAYTHTVNRGADQWFYFGRVIDTAGRVGPWFNNGGAIAGMSSMDADPILDQIAGEVTKDILGQELQAEINLITAPATVVGSVNNRVEKVRTDLSAQIQTISVDLTGLHSDVAALNQDVANINTQITTIAKAGLYQSNLTYTTGKSVRGTDDHLYTAIKAVPINTPPPNANYWLDVGQVAINENGSAARITALTTRVSNVEGVQTSQATLISGLRTDVNGKASQVAFDALKSEVTQNGTAITAQGQAITNLTTTVGEIAANGTNMLSDTYSWVTSLVLPVTWGSNTTRAGEAVAASDSGYGYRVVTTDPSTFSYAAFSPGGAGRYIMSIEPGTYLVSCYIKGDAAGIARANLYDGTTSRGTMAVPYTTSRTRLTFVIPVTDSAKVDLLLYPNWHGAASASVVIDSIMVEKRLGPSNVASPFVPGPSARSMAGLATATTALTTRVSNVEGSLASQAQSVTDLRASLGQVGGENLQFNSSFERQIEGRAVAEGWWHDGGNTSVVRTMSLVPSTIAAGLAQRMDISGLTPSSWGRIYTMSPYRIPVVAGTEYSVSVYTRGTPGLRVLLQIYGINAAGSSTTSWASPRVDQTEGWQRLTFTFTPTSPTETIYTSFVVYGGATATAGYCEIDQYQFEKGNVVTGWRDNIQGVALDVVANAAATTALTTRVTAAEGNLQSVSSNVTQLQNSLTVTNQNVTAAQNAANAANTLAGGKGKVIYGSAVPAVADRLDQNIWIDTTNNANTPKRWNGTAWVAVTDKVATDAANAAANALSVANTKADASAVTALTTRVGNVEGTQTSQGQSITQLQNNLTTTNTNVTAAQTAANNAATLAGSKGEVIYGGTPTVAQRLTQNIWIDTTNNANTPKRWNGSAWVAVSDKIATDAAAAAQQALTQVAQKADATAVTALTNTVTQMGNTVTSQGANIVNLTNVISRAVPNTPTKVYQSIFTSLSVDNWELTGAAGPIASFSNVAGNESGATMTFDSTPNQVNWWGSSTSRIKYDGTRLYKLTARVQQIDKGANNPAIYLGLCAYREDGVRVTNTGVPGNSSQHYVLASAVRPTVGEWATYTAYVQGFNPTNGGAGAGTIANPRQMIYNTAYISPMAIFGYSNQGGIAAMDYFTIEDVTEQAQIDANAAATTALTTRVTNVEGSLTSTSSQVTELTNSIGNLGGENLVYNPSFERVDPGTAWMADGWWHDGSSTAVTRTLSLVPSTIAPGNAQRMEVSGLTSSLWARIYTRSDRRFRVIPGVAYTGSLYVRGTAGLRILIQIYGINSAGSATTSWGSARTDATAEWQRINFTFTPTAGTEVVYPSFVVYGGATASAGFLEIDQYQVERGTAMSGWKDNGQVNAANLLVTSSALDVLTSTVSQQGTTLSSVSGRTTTLENSLTTTNGNVTAAQTAANNAATLAGSKGKTFYGTAAPAVAERLEQNLWIDTNGGANTPKRWNGSAWVAVSDKIATDAAAAAQQALTQVAQKADASAVQDLSSRVTATETGLTAQASALTRLEAAIGNVGGLDPAANGSWNFESTAEDWYVANATLTTNPGFVRITPSTTNPQFQSPNAFLNIDGKIYNKVRARITRRGGSAWNGTLYFSTAAHSFSSSYWKGAPNPNLAVGQSAIVEWDMTTLNAGGTDWVDNTIRRIRFDFANELASSWDVDWVAIGRNGPGASAQAVTQTQADVATVDGKLTAQVTRIDGLYTSVNGNTTAIQDERTARINADGALGQRIDITQSNINGVSANVQTISTAQTNLQNQANASFAVKLGVTSNGIYYASGFGTSLVNNQGVIQSTFAVLTDRFVVLNTTNNTLVSPFSIVNGQVIIRDALISQAAIRNAIIGSTLQSAAMTNWASGAEPVMTMDFNVGNVIVRNNTRAQTYSVQNAGGFQTVVDGILRFRAGVW